LFLFLVLVLVLFLVFVFTINIEQFFSLKFQHQNTILKSCTTKSLYNSHFCFNI
jgi:hypothetical protein